MSVIVIAEAGVNHNGDLTMAKRLVDAAAGAGADYVKFQTFNADKLVTRTAAKANYQILPDDERETQHAMLHRLELKPEMHEELIRYCGEVGIEFMSTAFDVDSAALLGSLGQRRFKIPSGEISNLPYLRCVSSIAEEIILSTGMATMGDIEAAIGALESSGTRRDRIVLLHCTSEYPAPIEEVNLLAMQTLKAAFGVQVGYSDHTRGIEVSIAAVAMGAAVIEKHLTLDRSLPGPDHQASLEPSELKAMTAAIRNIEMAMGDGVKRVMPSEAKNRVVARKSIVASRLIRAGEVLDSDNMTTKRPGNGISPMCWDDVIGRRARRDFCPDELITL